MKKIELTKGQIALVDDDDYERLNKHKWYAGWSQDVQSFYAVRNSKRGGKSKRHTIRMAREIMHAQPGQEVDHINHDTLDNRKANLRLCTNSENSRNKKRHKKGSSRYKGVYWDKQCRKWRAQISYGSKRHNLGLFIDEKEAACAYDVVAIEHFGEFAELNFPKEAP